MKTSATSAVIHKKKAPPSLKLAKTAFLLPQGNRFFGRVMGDRGVLAKSQCHNGEEETEKEGKEDGKTETGKTEVIRSASLHLSRKTSLLRDDGRGMDGKGH